MNFVSSSFIRVVRCLPAGFTFILALLPALLMTTTVGGSFGFYLLIVLSLAVLLLPPPSGMAVLPYPHQMYRSLGMGMAVMLVGVLCSQAVHGLWKGSEVEKAARLMSMLLILAAALRLPRRTLSLAIFGALPAVWCASLIIGWLVLESGLRPATRQFNAVTYGDLTLLFSVLCFLSIGLRLTRYARIEAGLKLFTGLLGVVAFLWTQTRGGLLAVPCLILIGLLAMSGRRRREYKAAVAAVLMAGLIVVVVQDDALRNRINTGIGEYSDCSSGHLENTSVCVRLQLWRAAADMIREQPVFGVGGGDRFREKLAAFAGQGKVSPTVARDFGEAHNDLLYFLAAYGVLGGLGLILTYLAPALILWPRLRHGGQDERIFAAAGLSLCVAFAVFGATEMMLRDMRTASFYAAWVALFLALSQPRGDHQLEASAA